ncbi:MAG TPA: YlzJ-like family protein [Limnochorda sp.]
MLYTIYPLELVLGEEEGEGPALVELSVAGRPVMAARDPSGGLTLHRLLSTDPADYLNPGFQPGTILPERLG